MQYLRAFFLFFFLDFFFPFGVPVGYEANQEQQETDVTDIRHFILVLNPSKLPCNRF
jgi:hypothetical protein